MKTANHKAFIIIALVTLVLSGSACKQDMEKINAMLTTLDLPDQSGKNIELHYSENGVLKRIFKSAEMERYNYNEDQFDLIFPKGIEVFIYNDSLELESTINSGYAEYHSETEIWEVRDNVVAKRLTKGEQLNTEKMFWDQKKKLLYSDVFTKLVNEDGTFIGEKGFEADENMEFYELKGATGLVNVENDAAE